MKVVIAFIAFLLISSFAQLGQLVWAQQNADVVKLVQGNTQFAIDLYQRIKKHGGNLCFSPYSITTAGAMAYGGARGKTAKQMADVLHFALEEKKLHLSFAEVQTRLNAIQQKERIQLSIANSLWPQDKYPFLNEYMQLVRNVYQAEIIPVDYIKDFEAARQEINSWVERKTNNRIRDVKFEVDSETRMTLANAIYFKGEWVSRFKKSDTKEMPFYPSKNETSKVPMMHQTNDLNYGEGDVLQILEMPYAGQALSMVIALPREIDGLQKLEEMLTADSFREWSKNPYKRPVDVYFPRFKMTFEFDLKKVLKEMGMTDAFAVGKANFSGMDGNPKWLYIGSATHKAFIEVNEEGTEAAAATVGGGGCFPSGTEVLTAGGPRKIETVEAGTKVYACDLSTGEWILTKILKRQSYQYDGDMITIQMGPVSIQATGNHPFYVLRGERLDLRPKPGDLPRAEQAKAEQGRWVEARDLKVGDTLREKSGKGLVISSLSSKQKQAEVYNLDVEDYHNYAVNQQGILVHNKGGAEAKPVLFRADHPFIFMIRDNLTRTILFMGRVSNPSIQ